MPKGDYLTNIAEESSTNGARQKTSKIHGLQDSSGEVVSKIVGQVSSPGSHSAKFIWQKSFGKPSRYSATYSARTVTQIHEPFHKNVRQSRSSNSLVKVDLQSCLANPDNSISLQSLSAKYAW